LVDGVTCLTFLHALPRHLFKLLRARKERMCLGVLLDEDVRMCKVDDTQRLEKKQASRAHFRHGSVLLNARNRRHLLGGIQESLEHIHHILGFGCLARLLCSLIGSFESKLVLQLLHEEQVSLTLAVEVRVFDLVAHLLQRCYYSP
jgi:hypothetical protein